MDAKPILFCHYGNSDYLPYVVEMARRSNPDKRIVLLGDASNAWLADAKGIEHLEFRELDYGPRLDTFHQNFRTVQGSAHGHLKKGRNWLKFVFERWFYVLNFLHAESIGSFWHFDSDNMITVPLAEHESRLDAYDCTEQCQGDCINGYVSNVSLIERYLDKINAIFSDSRLLDETQQDFDANEPRGALNEMLAYRWFKEESSLRSLRLATIHDGGMFDDCICQSHRMVMEPLFYGKRIKRIYAAPGGQFFVQRKSDDALLKLYSINLSWVPNELFDIVLRHATAPTESQRRPTPDQIERSPTLGQLMWKRHFLRTSYIHAKSKTRAFRYRLMGKAA